ncbi:MAG: PstS family phosphate ABC transporter substrate-binding protein [Candidatus Omnitrophica bacterium]|nr:PstS family phosphate ABC transporter substrate-binding protein [Candidatus Omnitrophota bacterium]
MKQFGIIGTAMVTVFALAGAAHAATIQVKGSDTLINLVQRLAEVYMEQADDSIAVTGGGSGTGIAAVINRKCDIANSSRLMKTSEIQKAQTGGVDVKYIAVAIDGLCVIVSAANPVKNLTKQQIGAIYRGEITNWQEVGGVNMPITLYGRQSNSGTYVFFMESVLKGDYSKKMNRANGNAQIVESVRADESGIGYVGVGYIKNDSRGVTVVKVAAQDGADYLSPLDSAAVNSGRYPLARPLYQYLNGTPKGAVRDFLAFELSPKGQRIVEEEGFFPLPQEYIDFNNKVMGK